jgi:hypothetical protein
MKVTKKISVEIEVEVDGNYTKGSPGSFYRSNGDPGDPPEPPVFEIYSVHFGEKDITKMLDDANFDWFQLEQEIIDDIENYEPDYDED